MKTPGKFLVGFAILTLATGVPLIVSAQVPFGGPILMIIPPSPVFFPFCPFPSFVIGPPYPGWYAFTGVGLLPFFALHPGSILLGMAEIAVPCGLVPGTIIYTGTTP